MDERRPLTLGDLARLRAVHRVAYTLESRGFASGSPDNAAGRPQLAIYLADYGDDGAPLRALLTDLEALGAAWPWGRTIGLVSADVPFADLYGEIPVLAGAPPWRLHVQIHGAPRRSDPPPARIEV